MGSSTTRPARARAASRTILAGTSTARPANVASVYPPACQDVMVDRSFARWLLSFPEASSMAVEGTSKLFSSMLLVEAFPALMCALGAWTRNEEQRHFGCKVH